MIKFIRLIDTKAREKKINQLWHEYQNIEKNPELMKIFARTASGLEASKVEEILGKHNFPARTRIAQINLGNWRKPLNPKFIKDGFIYLMRGDHQGQREDGFYSMPYGYAKLNTLQLTEKIKNPDDVGFFLFNDRKYFQTKAKGTYVAQEHALKQTQVGASSFISTTTNLATAQVGTGNQPSQSEIANTEIYIVKIPIEYAVACDTGNHYGLKEEEVLIPDFISPSEIVASFHRDDIEKICDFYKDELSITKADLGLDI